VSLLQFCLRNESQPGAVGVAADISINNKEAAAAAGVA